MTANQLGERYAQVFGEQTRARHKTYLVRKIAWRLQALAEGDLSIRARRRAQELANDAEVRLRRKRPTIDSQGRMRKVFEIGHIAISCAVVFDHET
jgi:hypothetical protein